MQNLIRLRSKLRRNQQIQAVKPQQKQKQPVEIKADAIEEIKADVIEENKEEVQQNSIGNKPQSKINSQKHQQHHQQQHQQEKPTDITEKQQPQLVIGQNSQLSQQLYHPSLQTQHDAKINVQNQQNQKMKEQLNPIQSDVSIEQPSKVPAVEVNNQSIQILAEPNIQRSEQPINKKSQQQIIEQSQSAMSEPMVIPQKKSKIQMLREKIRLKKSIQQSVLQVQSISQTSYKRSAQYQLQYSLEEPSKKQIEKPSIQIEKPSRQIEKQSKKQIEESSQISVEEQHQISVEQQSIIIQAVQLQQQQQIQQFNTHIQQIDQPIIEQKEPELLSSQGVNNLEKQQIQQQKIIAQNQEQNMPHQQDNKHMTAKNISVAPQFSHTLFYQLNQLQEYLQSLNSVTFQQAVPKSRQSSDRLWRKKQFLKQLEKLKHNIHLYESALQ